MFRKACNLLRNERGSGEVVAVALMIAIVLAVAFGPGKNLLKKTGEKFDRMGICIENPNDPLCP